MAMSVRAMQGHPAPALKIRASCAMVLHSPGTQALQAARHAVRLRGLCRAVL